MRHASITGLALFAIGAPAAALAQEADTIIVTAGRTEAPVAPAVEREEIELWQPAVGLDLLDRVPGVRAFSKGGAGGASYLSIRGGEPNFTMVLLDGIKANDPTNSRGGAFDFAQIDPDALERIDVARGAFSAVHGADALSGVVDLRLRRLGRGQQFTSARAAGDSAAGLVAGTTLGFGWDGGSALGNLSDYDSGGLTEGSTLDRRQGFGRIEQRLGALTASALALHARTDRSLFPEDSGGPRLAVNRARERRETALTLSGLTLSGLPQAAWQPRLSVSWIRQDDEGRTPAIADGPVLGGVPAIDADSRFERAEAIADHRFDLGSARLALGAAWLREEGRSRGFIDIGFPLPADFAIERSMTSLFAEATVRPASGLSATAALRYDDPSTARAEYTGRAALRWESARGLALFASWSEGYKLPSLYALGYPIIANPELKPERSRGIDGGIELRRGGARARLSLFRNRYADLIDFDFERFTNVNRSRVTMRGFEAEAAAPLSRSFGLSGQLAHLDSAVPDGVPPLRSRPKWQGRAALTWRATERIDTELAGAYTGAVFDSSIPTGLVTLDGRFVVSGALRYRLSPGLQAVVSGENLLDADHEDAVGYPAPGATLRLGLRYAPGG